MFLQTVAIVVAWLVPAALHASNDGLWYRGDAARHAINGLFWWDIISTLPFHPYNYALSYYARYPTISPLVYPPVFYIVEGIAFRLFAPSPYIAKCLVLACALFAGLYLAAWLRRYVALNAGWGGALLALQPGVVIWSNAVMINVPSMALAVVGLYYARRWMDEPSARRLWLVCAVGLLTALTYFPAGLVAIVLCAWSVGEGRWRLVWRRHYRVMLLGCAALVFLASALVHWVPLPFAYVLLPARELLSADKWRFYALALPEILNPSILFLAVCALPAALIEPRWRREVRLLMIWVAIVYCGLTYLWPREARYALLLAPALVLLATIGLLAAVDLAGWVLDLRVAHYVPLVLIGMIATDAWLACSVRVPTVDGFKEVAAFAVRESPTERIFYEGNSEGIFTFYVRAFDPSFRHGVVRGSKLLYASAVFPRWRLTERVFSESDVVRALENDCGCGWMVIERRRGDGEIAAVDYLRRAVQGPEFRLVRSFPVRDPGASQIDVYQFLGRVRIPEEIELPIPLLGEGTRISARPVER